REKKQEKEEAKKRWGIFQWETGEDGSEWIDLTWKACAEEKPGPWQKWAEAHPKKTAEWMVRNSQNWNKPLTGEDLVFPQPPVSVENNSEYGSLPDLGPDNSSFLSSSSSLKKVVDSEVLGKKIFFQEKLEVN